MEARHTSNLFTIYLLHFNEAVGGKSHYLGITRANRLEKRMVEHAHGRGASLTRRASQQGVEMLLVRTWQVESPEAERAFKRRSHFNRLCPICSPRLDDKAQPVTLSVLPPPLKDGGFKPWSW